MQIRRTSLAALLAGLSIAQGGCLRGDPAAQPLLVAPAREAPGRVVPATGPSGDLAPPADGAAARRVESLGRRTFALREGADARKFLGRLRARGLTVRAHDPALGLVSVAGPGSAAIPAGDPAVAGSWLDAPRSRLRAPRMKAEPPAPEPFEEAQWGLRSVRAAQAWQAGATGRGVRVAILDTGIDPDNPDLASQVDFARSTSLVPGEDLTDLNGHGSHVAGIVAAARNGFGVAGVAPEATLIVVKVLDRDAYGDDFGILRGIRHAADAGAQVINMSLEDRLEWGSPEAGQAAMAFSRAVRYAHMKGALVIAGTGNDAESERISGYTHLPAALPWVLGVSAVGPVGQQDFDAFAFYSNFGSTLVDVAAPGGGLAFDPLLGPYIADPADLVFSTWSTHALPHEVQGVPFGPAPWSYFAGTSMACAFASGAAALALQAHPEPPQAVASRLARTARPQGGRNQYVGAGVVDAFQAVVSR